jgi:hypothetical protein
MDSRGRMLRIAIVGAALALVLGVGSGWAWVQSERRKDVLTVSLANSLEATGFCANALQTGETAKLARLLEQRMDAALRQSERLVDGGARFGPEVPNLRESMARAAAHYERRNDRTREQLAERVLAKMADER